MAWAPTSLTMFLARSWIRCEAIMARSAASCSSSSRRFESASFGCGRADAEEPRAEPESDDQCRAREDQVQREQRAHRRNFSEHQKNQIVGGNRGGAVPHFDTNCAAETAAHQCADRNCGISQ